MKAEWHPGSEIDADLWDAFIQQSPQANFYFLHGYMNIVAPGWSAIVVKDGEKWEAVMPLNIIQRAGFSASLQPPLVQYWGPAFASDYPDKPYAAYSKKGKALQAILAAMPPKVKWFSHVFSPAFDYPLPFHWAKYQLHGRITYQLDLRQGQEALLANMASNTRYDLRKSEEWENHIALRPDIGDLVKLAHANAAAGKPLMPGKAIDMLSECWKYLQAKGMAYHFSARDEHGAPLASGLFVKFGRRMVYLSGAQDPNNKPTGLMARMVWKGIETGLEDCDIFDFEGSMIQGVEGFFRGFGASPIPLLHVQKNELPLLVRWITRSR